MTYQAPYDRRLVIFFVKRGGVLQKSCNPAHRPQLLTILPRAWVSVGFRFRPFQRYSSCTPKIGQPPP